MRLLPMARAVCSSAEAYGCAARGLRLCPWRRARGFQGRRPLRHGGSSETCTRLHRAPPDCEVIQPHLASSVLSSAQREGPSDAAQQGCGSKNVCITGAPRRRGTNVSASEDLAWPFHGLGHMRFSCPRHRKICRSLTHELRRNSQAERIGDHTKRSDVPPLTLCRYSR